MRYLAPFFALLLCSQLTLAEDYSVKWGLVLPMSGPVAEFGVDIRRGIEMAAEERAQSHVKHEIIVEDSRFHNSITASAAQKLISVHDVDILVALWDTADVVAPIAESRDRIHASIRWNSDIAEKFKNTFTFESTYSDYAEHFARLFQKLGIKKVSVLCLESAGWFLSRDFFLKVAPKYDLEIVSNQEYLSTENDFRVLATRALKEDPDMIFVFDNGQNLETFTRAVRALNPEQRVTGYLGHPIDISLFEGEYFVDQLSLDPDFAKRFERRYGEPVRSRAHLAYDLFTAIANAYETFESKPSNEELREQIQKSEPFDGMAGKILPSMNGKVFRTETKTRKVENGERISVSLDELSSR